RTVPPRPRVPCRFFFLGEACIRPLSVTGVQTCALPVCRAGSRPRTAPGGTRGPRLLAWEELYRRAAAASPGSAEPLIRQLHEARSEERRVGKECRSRWTP